MLVIDRDLKKWQKDSSEEEMVHYPVMYREVLEYISPADKQVIVDATCGVGSHALKILPQMREDSFYIGIDKDAESLRMARARLESYGNRVVLVNEDFRNIGSVLDTLHIPQVSAILLDLGISTYQLSDAERGFSFSREGPLDMRMDRQSFLCAADLVNNLSEKELATIFEKFGEERFARKIAQVLVRERRRAPFSTTSQLRDVIVHTLPLRSRKYKIHPATRVFQALRIAVNRELDCLHEGIEEAIARLSPGGVLVAISFHSLEDRIVKHTLKRHSLTKEVSILTKKPLVPGEAELGENKASRSAKLRAAEKI